MTGCGGGNGENSRTQESATSSTTSSTTSSANLFYIFDTNMNFVPWKFEGPVTTASASLQYVTQSTSKLTLTTIDKSTTFTATPSTGLSVKNNVSGLNETFPLPSSYPAFSWIMDITYDSKRNLVSIVSLGGTGYIYRFDAVNKTWLDYKSVNNYDYKAITYDEKNDRYIAITTNTFGSANIHLLNNDGLFNKSIPSTNLQNFDSGYTSQLSESESLKLITIENDLALVGISSGIIKSIWKLNIPNKYGLKTYSTP